MDRISESSGQSSVKEEDLLQVSAAQHRFHTAYGLHVSFEPQPLHRLACLCIKLVLSALLPKHAANTMSGGF